MTTAIYETTYVSEDHLGNVTAEADVRVEFIYEPGYKAPVCRIEGRVMEPDDDAEIEIAGIEIEDVITTKHPDGTFTNKIGYRATTNEEYDTLETWLEVFMVYLADRVAVDERDHGVHLRRSLQHPGP